MQSSSLRAYAKRLLAGVLAAVMMAGVMITTAPLASAASSTRKCYTISSGYTTVYSNTGLTTKYGTIYPTDELTVLTVTSKYCRVTYPVSKGTKTGYIATSAILTGTSTSNVKTATAKITTYVRNSTSKTYGSVSKGDTVYVLGTKGSYTQIKYPVSGGYKYAFITTSNANKYLKSTSSSSSSSTSTSSSNNYVLVTEGTYSIVTALSNSYCLDVANASTQNCANIQLYTTNGTSAQKFTISLVGDGWYKIQNASGKVLDVANGSSAAKTNVWQYTWNGSNAQLWRFISAGSGYYYIQNKLGNYLDVTDFKTANGTNIQVCDYNGTSAQKWKLTKVSTSSSSTSTSSSSSSRTNLSYALYKNSSAYITCGFDGYVNTSGRHEGIDIRCGLNKAVYSLTSGVVTRVTSGKTGSSGLSTIAIYDSTTNKTVIYLHSAPLSSIYVGQTISKGQQIATESWRGLSSSSTSHTHVEVRSGKQTAACKSVNDYTLENSNPTSFWNNQGYNVK